MPRVLDKIAQFQNVVAGQRAVINLPTDRRYHKLEILTTNGAVPAAMDEATMKSLLTNFRILLDGKEQRVFSATQAFGIYATYGETVKTGVFTIHFSEPWWQSPDSEDVFAWALRGQAREFQIEVDIDAAAVNPDLQCFAEFDSGFIPEKSRTIPLGFIKKWVKVTPQVGAAGPVILDDLPLNGSYSRLHAFEGVAGDITNAFFKADSTVLFNGNRTLMQKSIEDRGGVVAADMFTVAFDRNLRAGEALPTEVRDASGSRTKLVPLNLEYTLGAANNFDLIGEVIGSPN